MWWISLRSKKANDALIATIDDTLRIADEGKKQRREAEQQLVACEAELKQALTAAKARTVTPEPPAPPGTRS